MPDGTPAKGKNIGFDLVVDVDDDPVKPDRDQYSLYYFNDPGPSPCAGSALPYCDDRCWCTTPLE